MKIIVWLYLLEAKRLSFIVYCMEGILYVVLKGLGSFEWLLS